MTTLSFICSLITLAAALISFIYSDKLRKNSNRTNELYSKLMDEHIKVLKENQYLGDLVLQQQSKPYEVHQINGKIYQCYEMEYFKPVSDTTI